MRANDQVLDQIDVSTNQRINPQEFLDRGEAGDGEFFAKLFSREVVFDHSTGKWYVWNEYYWQQDIKGVVYNLVTNRLAGEYLEEASSQRMAGNLELSNRYLERSRQLTSRRRVQNVLWWASLQDGIGLTGDEWDKKPYLLPVENGVVDLTTGELGNGSPSDYLRSHAPVVWRGIDEPAPVWERTVLEIFGRDEELVSFSQRLLGYTITGVTVDHVLPIFYGDGRNGKGTILETLGVVLGSDFTIATQADAIMDTTRTGEGPQPFLYQLRGKRLAWASESKEGQKLNVGLVKQLTGGDTLNVRTLHSEPIAWTPTHKVILLTNHRPHIPSDDQAAWDRVLLIPFNMRFVDNPKAANERKRDPNLREKLLKESSGILAWLVRGCLAWQSIGLNLPETVKSATQEYRDDEDTVGLFIDELCVTGKDVKASAKQLFDAYREWAAGYGLQLMTIKPFTKRIRTRFGEPKRTAGGMIYIGVGLRSL